jgi:hypothetical protein
VDAGGLHQGEAVHDVELLSLDDGRADAELPVNCGAWRAISTCRLCWLLLGDDGEREVLRRRR